VTVSTDPGPAAETAAPGRTFRLGRDFAVAFSAGLLAGVVLLVAVVALVYRLNRDPGEDSAEAGFLRDMSTHHAQAVEMSMIVHAASTDPDVVTLAADIALTQQGQINYMQAWLRDWNLSPTGSRPAMAWMPDGAGAVVDGLMPGMATPQQIDALRHATGKQQDIQFLTLMRRHHLGGIHMAQEVVTLSKNADVDWLAGTMVASQQGEIASIDGMLKQLGAS